jgi:hypothetical protein
MRAHPRVERTQLVLRLRAWDLSLREVGPQMGRSDRAPGLLVRHASRRRERRDGRVPGPGRLALANQEELMLAVHAGKPFSAVAARLVEVISPPSRPEGRGGGRDKYRAWRSIIVRASGRRARAWSRPASSWPVALRPGPASGLRYRSRPGRSGRSCT